MSKAYALIPAAGTGTRVGAAVPKQYVEIAGRPMLYHALRSLARHPRIEQVLVVLAQGDQRFARCDWSEFGNRIEPLYCGGETRAATVFNGLLAAHDTQVNALQHRDVEDALIESFDQSGSTQDIVFFVSAHS